ncbi:MAG: helix-turn-helix domain-containing protein [Magnetococcales bacterium]|nr:helix-turn-helix domain-containing protein [Magnetococcales bacterium]
MAKKSKVEKNSPDTNPEPEPETEVEAVSKSEIRSNDTNNLSHRIQTARKFAGLTQKQLADRVDISQTAVHKIECGRSRSSRKTVAIALTCGVDPIWLDTGRGEMSLGGPGGEPGKAGAEGYRIPVIARIPLITWEEAKAYTPETAETHHPENVKAWIPVAPRTSIAAYALTVPDDSMEPEFSEGEIIIVDPTLKAEHNRFVIARSSDDSRATLKQLIVHGAKQYMKPLNARYPLTEIQGELIVSGVVTAKYKDY